MFIFCSWYLTLWTLKNGPPRRGSGKGSPRDSSIYIFISKEEPFIIERRTIPISMVSRRNGHKLWSIIFHRRWRSGIIRILFPREAVLPAWDMTQLVGQQSRSHTMIWMPSSCGFYELLVTYLFVLFYLQKSKRLEMYSLTFFFCKNLSHRKRISFGLVLLTRIESLRTYICPTFPG